MLQLPIVPQPRELCLPNCRVILASMPYPLDCLRDTDIVCLEFVEANTDDQRGQVQCPHERPPQCWVLVNWNIVDHNGPTRARLAQIIL